MVKEDEIIWKTIKYVERGSNCIKYDEWGRKRVKEDDRLSKRIKVIKSG